MSMTKLNTAVSYLRIFSSFYNQFEKVTEKNEVDAPTLNILS